MQCGNSRSGFTLIGVLVASVLLGMLVTILTMVFNQSSIAWTHGKAGVAQLSTVRRQLSLAQYQSDNLLPRIDANNKSSVGLVLSAWDESGQLRKRTVGRVDASGTFSLPSFSSLGSSSVQPWEMVTGLRTIQEGRQKSYVVGVLSFGPDKKRDTGDDITSWPGEVQ